MLELLDKGGERPSTARSILAIADAKTQPRYDATSTMVEIDVIECSGSGNGERYRALETYVEGDGRRRKKK